MTSSRRPTADAPAIDEPVAEEQLDVARIARDQIERRISSSFVGHDFTRLHGTFTRLQKDPLRTLRSSLELSDFGHSVTTAVRLGALSDRWAKANSPRLQE